MKMRSLCLAGLMLAAMTGQVQAAPIFVNYTVTGSTGNFDLDFSVTNNMLASPGMDVYFFGVELSAQNIIASPTGYVDNHVSTWDNTSYGGSSTIYNNIWFDIGYNHLFPGSTLSGFKVHVTDVAAPSSVKWFAFGYANGSGATYLDGDNFFFNYNPGFEGVASSSAAVPEPSSLAMLGVGAIGLVVARRKRQQKKLTV